MNHRHQHFDWDAELGERRRFWTHNSLRVCALSLGIVGLALASLLAWIGG